MFATRTLTWEANNGDSHLKDTVRNRVDDVDPDRSGVARNSGGSSVLRAVERDGLLRPLDGRAGKRALSDRGQRQAIQFFATQDAPVTVGLLIDSSGSMLPVSPAGMMSAMLPVGAKAAEPLLINPAGRGTGWYRDCLPKLAVTVRGGQQ